jgi:hypothetical protein
VKFKGPKEALCLYIHAQIKPAEGLEKQQLSCEAMMQSLAAGMGGGKRQEGEMCVIISSSKALYFHDMSIDPAERKKRKINCLVLKMAR